MRPSPAPREAAVSSSPASPGCPGRLIFSAGAQPAASNGLSCLQTLQNLQQINQRLQMQQMQQQMQQMQRQQLMQYPAGSVWPGVLAANQMAQPQPTQMLAAVPKVRPRARPRTLCRMHAHMPMHAHMHKGYLGGRRQGEAARRVGAQDEGADDGCRGEARPGVPA